MSFLRNADLSKYSMASSTELRKENPFFDGCFERNT